MQYDIVIATRNRPEALALSIPLMLGQSRCPRKLIVVDSSDDHGYVRKTVEDAIAGNRIQLEIVQSEPGSSLQRNIGLQRVEGEVVFFPDDDSIWFPEVAESIMRIYELDANGAIGGVCAGEASTPPPGVTGRCKTAYRMTTSSRVRQIIGPFRTKLERAIVPDPLLVHGRKYWEGKMVPSWMERENAIVVEYMTGFRMTFRTHMIRAHGFDTHLGSYALGEDCDASFAVAHQYLLIGARNARVFHYKSPTGRAGAFAMGMAQTLNPAYIICKHSDTNAPIRRYLHTYCCYKISQYVLGAHGRYGRARLRGAMAARKWIPRLARCSCDDLLSVYQEARHSCLTKDTV